MDVIIDAIIAEAARTDERFGPPTSAHESYGVLAEEMAELLAAIRSNEAAAVRGEAIQVSAVALRLARACAINEAFRRRSGFNGRC